MKNDKASYRNDGKAWATRSPAMGGLEAMRESCCLWPQQFDMAPCLPSHRWAWRIRMKQL